MTAPPADPTPDPTPDPTHDPTRRLVVTGGPSSTSARLDDLDRVVAVLDRAAARLAAVATRLAAVAADPALVATAPRSPVTWWAAERAITRAAGVSGALGAAGRWAVLGTSVRSAVVAYRAADAAADHAAQSVRVAAVRAAPALVVAPGALAVTVGAVAGSAVALGLRGGRPGTPAGRLAGQVVADLAAARAGTLERAVGALPAALGLPGGVPGLCRAAVLVTRAGPWLHEGSGVALRPPVATAPLAGTPPAGVADLVRRIAALDPATGAVPPGTVRVTVVRHPGRPAAWLVEIPGTQDWSPRAGSNPFDLSGNVHGMAGEPTAGRRLVAAALDRAGARAGEPVVLAGYSQGGLVAVQLAADPRFGSAHPVAGVVTVGAPTGAAAVPAAVPVLSLEHADDVIPRADGQPNPGRAGWVTVSRATAEAPGGADAVAAHDLGAYAVTGDLVDRSTDPGVVRARAVLAPVLDGPGAIAESRLVTGERVP